MDKRGVFFFTSGIVITALCLAIICYEHFFEASPPARYPAASLILVIVLGVLFILIGINSKKINSI